MDSSGAPERDRERERLGAEVMGSGASTQSAAAFDRTAASLAPHLTARDAKGLIFSALRTGSPDTGALTQRQALAQISQYRATLKKWVVDAAPARRGNGGVGYVMSGTNNVAIDASGTARLPAALAEELLESNWRARNVERAYSTHVGRARRPAEVVAFVLEFCTVREWIECAAVCRAWSRAVCADDALWADFLADVCAPTLVAQDFQRCKMLADDISTGTTDPKELQTMVLLTGIPTSDGPEKNGVQAVTLESKQWFMWDSFANRELISAHLSVMPEVLPPSELSSGMNRNVVEATSWKWGKTIGWVGFFEVASWFLALAPSRTAVWASDPDCVQLSINKSLSFSELRCLQTGKDGQLLSFDLETGALVIAGPVAEVREKPRQQREEEDEEEDSEEYEYKDEGDDDDDDKRNSTSQPKSSTPCKSFLARAFSLQTQSVERFAKNLAVKSGCYRTPHTVRAIEASSITSSSDTDRHPATRPAFTTLLLARIGRLLVGHATAFDLEFAGTVCNVERDFLDRFPSALSRYAGLPKQGHRRTLYQNTLWAITTVDFAICFDVQRAELHLEKYEDPVCLWNEFHLRRTRLGMAPMSITEDLARELAKHFLTPRVKGSASVITTEVANRRWHTLLFLHWIYCHKPSQQRPEDGGSDNGDDDDDDEEEEEEEEDGEAVKENPVYQYVNEGMCEKARTYMRERISSLLPKYVMDFQRRNQPESVLDDTSEIKFGVKEEDGDGLKNSKDSLTGHGFSMKIIFEGEEEQDSGEEGKRENHDSVRIETDTSIQNLSGKNSESMLGTSNLGGLHGGGGSNISAPGSIAAPGDRSWLEGTGQDNFAVPEGSPRANEILGITSPRE